MMDHHEKMLVEVSVTRYYIPDSGEEVVTTTAAEEMTASVEHHRGEDWLFIGPGSALVERLREGAKRGVGWAVDGGSPPVYVKPCPSGPRVCGPDCGCGPGDDVGGWGGRNYPRVEVSCAELRRVLAEVTR